jgi:ABC-type amino acid transport substrate-binding protein
MDERTDFERRLAAALERHAGPSRPVDAMVIAQRARAEGIRRRDEQRRRLTIVGKRFPLLAAAALLLTGGIAIVGSYLARDSEPDLLTRLMESGAARIGVRPDHPQARGTGALDGFDIDVATELGRRLGLAADVQPVEPTRLLDADKTVDVDILLPSIATSAIDPTRFAHSVPYYWWPHYLVVTVASGRTDVGQLAGQAICAVVGDAGESWLRGVGGTTPIDGSTVVPRATDAECLSALMDGSVAGIVTARMGPADLAARPSLAVLGGPPAEPRVVVAWLEQQPASLIVEIDAALAGMHDDGTLAQLSRNRFGGYDLTRSPAP